MMKIIMIFFLVLGFSSEAFSDQYNFENTSEGMIEKLTNKNKFKFRTRSLKKEPFSSKTRKTRGLTTLRQDKGKLIKEEIRVPEKRESGFVNLKIIFDYNSYQLRTESIQVLEELGKALNDEKLKNKLFFINGHTDSDGTEDYNLNLSLHRASAVRNYLSQNLNISQSRLKLMGYGEGMPLVANSTPENKQLNRRVEIVVSE